MRLSAVALAGMFAGIFAEIHAQESAERDSAAAVICESAPGGRRNCPADTSAGVSLIQSIGAGECIRGATWGYDETSVWVADGCSAEFSVGAAAPVVAGEANGPQPGDRAAPAQRIESWGEFEPGDGFLIGRNDVGELSVSAYALLRYINQTPSEQTFSDHLGNEHPVDTRQDFLPHRVMVFLKGWVGRPQLIYNIFFWTVNATDQDALFASLGYQFSRKFSLYGGINGTPGSRSLQGSHPYWLGHDRVMADEFFRPYFSFGVWAQGEIMPGLWYNTGVYNNSSALGIKAVQLDREVSTGASFWWMPTTHEFGPRGGYGDWEWHEELATRFGISMVQSPEERFTDAGTGSPGNTTLKLADSLNVFDTGALAPGVTVEKVDYRILSLDAGLKYRGIFLQAELYRRQLDNFQADGLLPVAAIEDDGFYIQGAFFPVPKKLELYAATSRIYGDEAAGFDDSHENLVGMNWYPMDTRNHRLNFQVIDVNRSPVSSTFGYYVGGHVGTTYSLAFSVFF